MNAASKTTQSQNPLQLQSAFKLFTPSIHAIATNFWTFLGLALIPALFVLIFMVLASAFGVSFDSDSSSSSSAAFVILIAIGIVAGVYISALISAAVAVTQLASLQNVTIPFKEAINRAMPFVWRNLGLKVILCLLYIISLLLFIVPFFFMLRRYYLATYYLIDYNLSIKQAMRMSAEQSKQFSGAVWGLIGVTILAALLSFGSNILSIFYSCAPVVRFREITDASNKLSHIAVHESQSESKQEAISA